MTWFLVLVALAVLGAFVVVAARGGAVVPDVHDDRPDVLLPVDGPLTADDLDRVRFTTTWRGYRPHEVDALLRRLRGELAARDDAPVER